MAAKNAMPLFTPAFGVAASAAEALDSLDGIDTTALDSGASGWVKTGPNANTLYQLDKTSTATPNGTSVIAPLSGPGRWLEFSGGGASGQVLQSVTAAAREIQNFTTAGLVEVEKEASTNPGVRLQCELPSVLPTSSLRLTANIPLILLVTKVAPINQFIVEPRLAFPDDSPSPMPVSVATLTQLPRSDCTAIPTTINPGDPVAFSYLFPISALSGLGGPPTGRVQFYLEAAPGSGSDAFRINSFPFAGSATWGAGAALSLEEVAGTVVQ